MAERFADTIIASEEGALCVPLAEVKGARNSGSTCAPYRELDTTGWNTVPGTSLRGLYTSEEYRYKTVYRA